jgi:hypothetical protein
MVLALDRVAEIAGLRMREADIASVPTRRVIELARYGIAAKAPKLSRHPYRRKIAMLLAARPGPASNGQRFAAASRAARVR